MKNIAFRTISNLRFEMTGWGIEFFNFKINPLVFQFATFKFYFLSIMCGFSFIDDGRGISS